MYEEGDSSGVIAELWKGMPKRPWDKDAFGAKVTWARDCGFVLRNGPAAGLKTVPVPLCAWIERTRLGVSTLCQGERR